MTPSRLFAIGGIVLATSIAWFVLGRTVSVRTADTGRRLAHEVQGNWGSPMNQLHPRIYYISPTGARAKRTIEPASSRVAIDLYVTDARGVVLFDSREPQNEGRSLRHFRDVSLTLLGKYGARSTRTNEEDKLSSIMFVGAPVYSGDDIVGMVSVSKPQASLWAFVEETQRKIFLFGWLIFLLVALAAVVISHWGSQPIRKLTEYARAVRRSERAALPELGSPDARTLGRALDEMRESLEDRKYVEIVVDDEGPGVPDYARNRVFDRFYSLQHPGTGKKSSGLGLCFVKEAAELHGGSANLTNRPDGGAKAVLAIRVKA